MVKNFIIELIEFINYNISYSIIVIGNVLKKHLHKKIQYL